VAVRGDGSFEDLVCGGIELPCMSCETAVPRDALASCDDGHCSVVYLLE
jgi:hypothetical protein